MKRSFKSSCGQRGPGRRPRRAGLPAPRHGASGSRALRFRRERRNPCQAEGGSEAGSVRGCAPVAALRAAAGSHNQAIVRSVPVLVRFGAALDGTPPKAVAADDSRSPGAGQLRPHPGSSERQSLGGVARDSPPRRRGGRGIAAFAGPANGRAWSDQSFNRIG